MRNYPTGIVKIALTGLFCCIISVAQAQLFSTSTGVTSFSGTTPLENIEAENKKSQAMLNTTTGEIAIRMNMTGFVFPNKLMQEHFNENYIESEKYPTATFSGKVTKPGDYTKDGTYDVSATGKFTLHGVTKERAIDGKLAISGGKITLTSDFKVALVDHKIEVPQIVFVKIAQVISVKANYVLMPYKK